MSAYHTTHRTTAARRSDACRGSRHARPALGAPLLAILLCAPLPGLALSVGTPRLLSAYAEPLRVQVPVLFDPSEQSAGELSVQMLPESEYRRYGVAEQHIDPTRISARFDSASGQIEIESATPIEEPAAVLLLQVSLGGTRIIKEVPLLFDFPTQGATAAALASASPGATAPAASDAAATPLPETAPAAAGGPAAAAPRPARHHRHSQPAEAAPAVATFQLSRHLRTAAPNYTSATAGLRLAESFDSYAEYQRSQPAPQPVPAPIPAPQPAPVAEQPPAAAVKPAGQVEQAPQALPVHRPAPPQGGDGLSPLQWLALLGLMAAAAWLMLRRRGAAAPAPHGEAAPMPQPQTQQPAPVAQTSATPEAVAESPLRERLRRLTRGKLDPDLARRALLVEAFLDLRRDDSAARLLDELERDMAEAAPRGGADIAAAVRR